MSSDPRPQVLYLVRREAQAAIFDSQVLTPLIRLADTCRVRLAVHVPVGQFFRRSARRKLSAIRRRARQAGIPVHWLPSPPSRWPKLWDDTRVLRRFLKAKFGRPEPFILHCRNSVMTAMALDAAADFPNARIVFDVRGDDVSEAAERRRLEDFSEPSSHPEISAAWGAQRRATRQAHGVTAVSEAMLEMLEERYGPELRPKAIVIPCCPEVGDFQTTAQSRDDVRRQLGLQDRFVVTYLGSLSSHQMPTYSLRVFQAIRRLRPQAHFLAITTQPEAMRRELDKAGIPEPEATIRSIPPREVPRMLSASDVALLLRQQDAVNRVASPVKCGEYLAAGIPVIITPDVGDYSRAIAGFRLGAVVQLAAPDAELEQVLGRWLDAYQEDPAAFRERCRAFAAEHLNWDTYVPRRVVLYRRLLRLPDDA